MIIRSTLLATVAILPVLLLGCTSPISGNIADDALSTPAGKVLATDLTATAFNLNSAVKVGALPATDPATGCVNSALAQFGLTAPAGPSFVPENVGPISAGSIVYIRAQQLKAAAGTLSGDLPVPCEALIGKLVVDGIKAGNQIGNIAGQIGLLVVK